MKNKEKWLLLVFMGLLGFANAQDTLVLRNNTRVVCTVTQIYAERIEYVSFGDSVKKQYYSYRKNDVMLVRYADGRTDTFNNTALVVSYDDTSADAKRQYTRGYEDGLTRYRPNRERIDGVSAGILTFVSPIAIVVPVVYSFTKVPSRRIQDSEFTESKFESYRKGYLAGAKKRRSRAVWSAYGITTGTCAVGIGLLVFALFY